MWWAGPGFMLLGKLLALALWASGFFTRKVCHPIVEWWLNSVVATWEETVKSFFREVFFFTIRAVNGFSASFISIFVDKDYYRNIQRGFARKNVWQEWNSQKQASTFNALIEQQAMLRDDQRGEELDRNGATDRKDADSGASSAGSSPIPASFWRFLSRRKAPGTGGSGYTAPSGAVLRRTGSDLFNPHPDHGANASGSGLTEDISTAVELTITRAFDLFRTAVRFFWRIPVETQALNGAAKGGHRASADWKQRQGAEGGMRAMHIESGLNLNLTASNPNQPGLTRRKSFSMLEMIPRSRTSLSEASGAAPRTAADVLRASGYPYQRHVVITDDGYVLQMDRIPRKEAKDVAFFMHGILDTSLGWVANGVTGSIAFAAYDQGFDVWLGSCRSNPPRRHSDPAMEGSAYWGYSINELGELDTGAQVDHIHVVKCAELGAAGHIHAEDFGVVRKRSSLDERTPASAARDAGEDGALLGAEGSPRQAALTPMALKRSARTLGVEGSANLAPRCCGELAGGDEALLSEAGVRTSSLPDMLGGQSLRRRRPDPGFQTRLANALTGEADTHDGGGRSASPQQQGSAGGNTQQSSADASKPRPRAPYRLRAVGHSLGGAMLLIYAVRRLMAGRPHHLSRLILLTPAGFHDKPPLIARPFVMLNPLWSWLLRRSMPNGTGLYVPTSLLRATITKVMVDLQAIPALGELARHFMRAAMSGDSSQWDQALQLPHYNPSHMPAVSAHTLLHVFQLMDTGRFRLYDHGSATANREAYGIPAPPDIAANYHLMDVPVDLMAGLNDGVISAENMHRHLHALQASRSQVTLKDFASGHLDFTFSLKDDLRTYILSRLRL